MNKDFDWEFYLERPFSIFGASVWHYWYSSKQIEELLGYNIGDAMFIESRPGSVRHYRTRKNLKKYFQSLNELGFDKKKTIEILNKGIQLQNESRAKIKNNDFGTLEDEIEFVVSVALHATIVPYFVSEHQKDKEIKKLCEQLRDKSVYPELIECIKDIARERLKELGADPEHVNLITIDELKKGAVNNLEERATMNKRFVLSFIDNNQELDWLNNTDALILEIEGEASKEVKGQTAFSGKAKSVARLFFSSTHPRFEKGDIIIASYTSPDIMTYLQKASAVVTDEGGMMCHAAIIARELKIPCIVGTKNATKVIKEGDLIEVDADKGIVTFQD